jgi:hypothetical protein
MLGGVFWPLLRIGFVVVLAAIGTFHVPASDRQTTSLSAGMVIDRPSTIRPGLLQQEAARDRLDYLSGRSIDKGVVWLDGEEGIDAWTLHQSKANRATSRGDRKKFKVEYYEIGGFAELRFDIQRR